MFRSLYVVGGGIALLVCGSLGHADEAYRYQDKKIALESVENQGLFGREIAPAEPLKFPRPVPLPAYDRKGLHPEKPGSVTRRTVEARLSGSGHAPVSSGFPLPQGALFDPARLRVLDTEGEEIPAQVSATTFWPDGSLRWALLEFAPRGREFSVEFGNDVRRQEAGSPLRLERQDGEMIIHTGALRVAVNPGRFNFLSKVSSQDGRQDFGGFAPEGGRIVGADGTVYFTVAVAPTAVSVEQEGPETLVLRIAGAYGSAEGRTFMSYVTRLVFHANSPVVEIIHRHINTELEQEFTDFRSLDMTYDLAASGKAEGRLLLGQGKESPTAPRVSLVQEDDKSSQWIAGAESGKSGRAPGVLGISGGGRRMAVAVADFWQRWPKSLSLTDGKIQIGLLPPQPSPDYGTKLPAHLMFPFVNGLYRLKWGMAFTERVFFDFAATEKLQVVANAVNEPPVAIFPSGWYAETQAIGPLAPQDGEEFAEWDEFFARGTQNYLGRREKNREYGFLNYGDWWGERGRNWGNGEYDIGHTFFMQFARTGQPQYFRIAQAAARHQADVDIVHAYPDPAFIGANPQHSIGHTGQWSQEPERATWSHRYDSHTDANNGHTWAEGMAEAWWLTGDPTIMESARQLGEHITWAVAPHFQISESSPRSAGWSLRAIVALYEATGDPEYLKAAGAIARSAVAAQTSEGIWIRGFKDKGSEEKGVSNFQLGLTLAGLERYAEVSGDPDAREAVDRGVRFLARAWPGSGGWPYDIRPDATPSSSRPYQMPRGNILNVESVASAALRQKDPALRQLTEEVVRNALFYGEPVASGQIIGLMLRSGQAVLGPLHAAYREQGGKWPGLAVEQNPGVFFSGLIPSRSFKLRGPGTLTYRLKLREQHGTLKLSRVDSNPFFSGKRSVRLSLRGRDGGVITDKELSVTQPSQKFDLELPGGAGRVVDLRIEEPERGIWDFNPAPLGGGMIKSDGGVMLASTSAMTFVLIPDPGAEQITVDFESWQSGSRGVALLDGEKLLGFRRLLDGGGQLNIQLPPASRNKQLTLAVWAGGDFGLKTHGATWLARTPEEAFPPNP